MVSIARILCPVDFSDQSRHALAHAATLARWYGAELTALNVFTPVVIPPMLLTPELIEATVPTPAGLQRLHQQLEAWLEPFAGWGVRTKPVLEQGDATRCILDLAASMPADMIVLGTHGHGGFDRLVLGSVAEKVLRKAACPVMTVPPPAAQPRVLPFKRLLCAVDFSQPSLTALGYALSIAKESDARLMIVHVLEWPEPHEETLDAVVRQVLASRRDEAARRLDALLSEEDRVWCQPVTRVEHGRAWAAILTIADQELADLIVMGIHGRNAVDLTLFGSTTNQVVRRAPCPVLTLRQ